MASSGDPADHLYTVLGFDPSVVDVLSLTAREIASAYRRAALRHHPDKNPGDAGAAAALERVFLAHEVLGDESSRAEVDDAVRAARVRADEVRAMDAGRRRLREDLERRERANESRRATQVSGDVEARLKREIERLRMEHGLAGGAVGAGGKGVEDEVGARRGSRSIRDGGGRENRSLSAWERVPGYEQWKSGVIEFDMLERAVLTRARGEMPARSDAEG